MPRIVPFGVVIATLSVAGATMAQTAPATAASPQAASVPANPAPQAASSPKPPSPAVAVEAPASGSKSETPSAMAGGATEPPPLASQGYTYKAEGRRDPFVTLVKRGSDAAATTAAARTAGLAGLGTGEVTLRGILASQGGYVAMLLGSDEKTYIVRSGDKLSDGTIRTITADAMVILQQINDPLSHQKQREVRKMLRHMDGTN